MIAFLLLLIVVGIIGGLAMLIIGIVKLCKQAVKTAGILFTVFGGLLFFVTMIVVIGVLMAGLLL